MTEKWKLKFSGILLLLNLKLAFIPKKILDGCFFGASLFSFLNQCIIVRVLTYGYIKIHGPNSKLPCPPYLFTKIKYFLSKT